MLVALVLAQVAASMIVLSRLASGRRRRPPVSPLPGGLGTTTVSVILPTRNEANRIGPCLEGLMRQGLPLVEVLVVDGGSSDGTRALVAEASARDARIRLVDEPQLATGWIGKVWALQHGAALATSEWILGIDADIEPQLGMVAGVVRAALDSRLEMVSFSPRFAGQTAGERFLQPGLLMTLIYRCGVPGSGDGTDRVLANGQCFLMKRDVLVRHGGYEPARNSFSDDVTLARHYATRGVRVGFLDGTELYRVRSYKSGGMMWREWGRSIDLKDATSPLRQWIDLATLLLVQGLPIPLLLLYVAGRWRLASLWSAALLLVNALLLLLHQAMRAAVAQAYERRGLAFWLSAAADPLAVVRVFLSTFRRPRSWRGRSYRSNGQITPRAATR